MLHTNIKKGAFVEGLNSAEADRFPVDLIQGASSHSAQVLSLCMRYQQLQSEPFPLVISSGRQSLRVNQHQLLHQSSDLPYGSGNAKNLAESACYQLGVLISVLAKLGEIRTCIRVILLPASELPAYGRFLLGVPLVAHGRFPKALMNSQCLLVNHRPRDSLDRHLYESRFNGLLRRKDRLNKDPALRIFDVLRQHPTIRDIKDIASLLNLPPRQLNQQLVALGTSFFQVMDFYQRDQLVQELKASNDDYQDVAGRLNMNSTRRLGNACHRWFHRSPESIRYRA